MKEEDSDSTIKPDFDIILIATARWDSPYSSTAFSLAKALSRYTRVFYIDNPFTLKYYLANSKKAEMKQRRNALLRGTDVFRHCDPEHPNLVAVTPRFIWPMNWMGAGRAYDFVSRINDGIISKAINKTIKAFDIRKYVFINSFNSFFGRYFKLDLQPALRIYQNIDNISESPYLKKHGVRLEIEALKSYDLTVVTSTELLRRSSKHTDKIFLLPNAANVKLFSQAKHSSLPKPGPLQHIPQGKKIIIYTGNICLRLDYDLLVKIAMLHPDKILVMVGPISHPGASQSGLDKMQNVIFTGRKDISELPAYIQHSDCCIIPFLCNELTKSIYPLKINEYLSTGKPVVSTMFSEDILSFKDVMLPSATHEEFVRNIDLAIDTDSAARQELRARTASGNSWEARASLLLNTIDKLLNRSTEENPPKPNPRSETKVRNGARVANSIQYNQDI